MLEAPAIKSYLLRIELLHTHRPIWREVWVPSDMTLDVLHDVIQEAMGWDDDHMHGFEFKKQQFQSVEFMDGFDDDAGKPEELVELSELLKRVRQKLTYTYDFGDSWKHSVILKKQVPLARDELFTCIAGEGACPMEDCGGVYGHERVCAFAKDGVDDGFMPYEEWGVGEYDPDAFDIDAVNKELVDLKDDWDEEMELDEDADLDDAMAEMWDFGDEDRRGFLPGFDADGDGGGEDEEPPIEPYANLQEADRDLFIEALDRAKSLRAVEPWEDLWDQDVFCVRDPQTGLLDFVSILGKGGEVFALHVHRGVEAYKLWGLTFLGQMPQDPEEYLRCLRMTEVEFVNKAQMEAEDLKLYEQLCYSEPKHGRLRWMRFRRYHPRAGAPWFPSSEDLPGLIRGMRLCDRYIGLLRSSSADKSQFFVGGRDGELPLTIPCFTLPAGKKAEDIEAWEFSQKQMDWDAAEAAKEPFEPSEFEVQRMASLPVAQETWELGAIYLSNPIGTDNGPVIPILAVVAPLAAMDEPPRPYFVDDLEVSPAQAVWDCFVAEAVRRDVRPAEVHVTTPVAQRVLQPLAAVSSTEVVLQPQFQQLHQLLDMLSRM